jgi:hypothetical protein
VAVSRSVSLTVRTRTKALFAFLVSFAVSFDRAGAAECPGRAKKAQHRTIL